MSGPDVLIVVGARPQFVKAAPLCRAFHARGITQELVHTGQHHDAEMSTVFFDELGLAAPDHHLGVAGGGHGDMTGRMLVALEPVVEDRVPAVVVVVGDTNTTLAAALVAGKLGIPVAHVEAGLRSFDRSMPEEINRVLVDHVSDLLFCPTTAAVRNLAAEGLHEGVHHVGDVMYDATVWAARRAHGIETPASRRGLSPGEYAVATIHRAASTASAAALGALLGYLERESTEVPIVLPLHPRTRAALETFGLAPRELHLVEPVGYLEMMALLASAVRVYTDSGGLQKEAYFHRVPCVTLRDTTEWTETVDAGWNRLWSDPEWRTPRRDIEEYGDGDAAGRIASVVEAAIDRRRATSSVRQVPAPQSAT